jgi:hypothetical protein
MKTIKTSAIIEDSEYLRLINKVKNNTGKKFLLQSAPIRKQSFLVLVARD